MRRPRGRSGGHGGSYSGGGGGGGGGSGHPNPNRPPNRNQSYDSNGPDVRVRGTAYQIFEKYQGLAREATSSGDRILAEAYYQYAEHYFRIIQQLGGYVPRNTEGQWQDEGNGAQQQNPDQAGAPQGGEGGVQAPHQAGPQGEQGGGPQGHPGQHGQGGQHPGQQGHPAQHGRPGPQEHQQRERGPGGPNGGGRFQQREPREPREPRDQSVQQHGGDRNGGGEPRSVYGEAQVRRPDRGPRPNDPAQADQPDITFATYDRSEPV